MRKLTVTKNLNVRVGKPSVNAASYQYLRPGSIIDVEDEIIKGDMYEGSDKWVKDPAGNHYWLGGFEDEAVNKKSDLNYLQSFNKFTDNGINYNQLLRITLENIKHSNGKNVNIGILDSPIYKHVAIKNIVRGANTSTPKANHGTAMASIIAGSGKITGIATEAIIHEMPLVNQKGNPSKEAMDFIVNYLKENKQKNFLLNISADLKGAIYSDGINELIQLKNVIIFAAAGTDNELCNTNLQIPSNIEGVISVGSLTQKIEGTFNDKLDFIVPEFKYHVYNSAQNSSELSDGDSSACAVVCGTAALLYSSNQNIPFTPADCISELKKIAIPYSNALDFTNINLIYVNHEKNN